MKEKFLESFLKIVEVQYIWLILERKSFFITLLFPDLKVNFSMTEIVKTIFEKQSILQTNNYI